MADGVSPYGSSAIDVSSWTDRSDTKSRAARTADR